MENEKRLIDAKRVRYELDIALMESYGKRRVGIADAIEIINMMPTVDAVEVVHGRWEKAEYHGFLRCSECKDVYIDDTWIADGKWNYCPNCGADMR